MQLALAAPVRGAWRFDADIVWLDYQELDSFDQLNFDTGARYRHALGDWQGEAALRFAYALLDGEGFERRNMLVLQASRPLTDEWRLRARYRFSDIDGLDGFDGLDGRRHQLSLRGLWRRDGWELTMTYRFDSSDHDEANLSYDRHQVAADLQRTLDDKWDLQVGLTHDRSRYDVTANGSERRSEVQLAVIRGLGSQWRAVGRYAYADNRADLEEFDYRRSRFSLGVEAVW